MDNAKGKQLTKELVFNKTKSDNLHNIKNLNLWGNELQDLRLIEEMPNLEVISLSVNKIQSLRDFAKCAKLQELYLRKNCINDLKEIRYLVNLQSLRSLWLYDNPCAQVDNYRSIVIHHLPNLTKLDNTVVTNEQKVIAINPKFKIDLSEPAPQSNQSYYQNTPEVGRRPEPQSQIRKSRPFSEVHRQQRHSNEPGWRGGSNKDANRYYQANEQQLNRNKNILIAVLSLMKELDAGSLQIVRKEAEKELRNK